MKYKILFFFCFLYSFCFSQQSKEKVYYLNTDFNIVTEESMAIYLLSISKKDDATYRYGYYNKFTLRLVKVETYTDEDGNNPTGFWGFYNSNGQLDSCGYVSDGKRDRYWLYYDAKSSKPDSAVKSIYYSNGKVIEPPPTITIKKDSIKEEISTFKGNYKKFLAKELRFPEIAVKNKFSGIVKVLFVVTEKGIVEEIELQKSQNYYLDTEAIRVIKKSSTKWNPGKQNGVEVKSYHLQNVLFEISENNYTSLQ